MSDIVPPIPSVPFNDVRTGLPSREWYRFFLALWNRTGGANGGGGSPSDTTGDNILGLFPDEYQRELLGTTNQVIVTGGTQMSGRTIFATPQDIDTGADVTFDSATLTNSGTSLTTTGSIEIGADANITGNGNIDGNLVVLGNSTLGNAAADNTTITGYLNPYVAFGNGTDWTANTLGGIQFTSPSSVANNKARAYIRLLQKPYTAAPSNPSDSNAGVGLWISGNYAGLPSTAVPVYLGGVNTSTSQYAGAIVDTNGSILAMDTGVNGSYVQVGYAFQSDPQTGLRRISSGQTRIVGSNTDIAAFEGTAPSANYASKTTIFGKLATAAGPASDPSISIGTSNTGFYSGGGGDVGFSSNGTKAGAITSSQRWLIGPTITDNSSDRLQVEGGIRASYWQNVAGLGLYAAVHG